MPIVDTIEVAHQLIALQTNYKDKTGTAVFERYENGQYTGTRTMYVNGDELTDMYGLLINDYPLAYHVTDAVYATAIKKGFFSGKPVIDTPAVPVEEAPLEPIKE